MSEPQIPQLSVVVVSFNTPALLERCLASLVTRNGVTDAEILVVRSAERSGRDIEHLQAPGASHEVAERLRGVRWVTAPAHSTVPWMRALGILASRGDVVALIEDDCVAGPSWCDTTVGAHSGPEAAVGGAVAPGDYRGALDWAAYFSEYGRFMPPLRSGPAASLPGTNVSYKRPALTGLIRTWKDLDRPAAGHGLYEAFFHGELLKRGVGLKIDQALVVTNVNAWDALSVLRSRFHHARGFAGMRAAAWSLAARLAHLVAVPALPILQVGRIARAVSGNTQYIGRFAAALPWLILMALAWSAGEFAGYLLGPGSSLQQWR